MSSTIVIGAGAAGLVAAIFAAEHSDVTVVERTSDGGRKILISGGGRCNILPSALQPERFVTESPAHLLRAMLRSWPLTAQREFFETEAGIPLKLEEATGKLFPISNSAREVRDRLIDLAKRRGVTFQFETSLTGLRPTASSPDGMKDSETASGRWCVETTRGELNGDAVVLATGGLSVPTTGSDGTGLRLAEVLGLKMHAPYAALTPLTTDPAVHAGLSGISLDVRLRSKWRGKILETTGGFLFTHRGYSGPSVLDLSHTAVRSRMSGDVAPDAAVIRVAWTPLDANAWLEELASSAALVMTTVSRRVPSRLAEMLLAHAGVPLDRRATELRRTERVALVDALTAFVLPWTGDEGFKKAEVTGGGVALDEVDPKTLESKRHKGLFLCGEILDAFGPIGGYNFAWAWSTGCSAGRGASKQWGNGGSDGNDGNGRA